MSESYRHHRAHAGGPSNTVVVFVPIEGGSPKEANRGRPAPYPSNRREPWRPATRPPSKAAATVRLLNAIARQDMEIAEFMKQAREASRHAE